MQYIVKCNMSYVVRSTVQNCAVGEVSRRDVRADLPGIGGTSAPEGSAVALHHIGPGKKKHELGKEGTQGVSERSSTVLSSWVQSCQYSTGHYYSTVLCVLSLDDR